MFHPLVSGTMPPWLSHPRASTLILTHTKAAGLWHWSMQPQTTKKLLGPKSLNNTSTGTQSLLHSHKQWPHSWDTDWEQRSAVFAQKLKHGSSATTLFSRQQRRQNNVLITCHTQQNRLQSSVQAPCLSPCRQVSQTCVILTFEFPHVPRNTKNHVDESTKAMPCQCIMNAAVLDD